MLVAGLLLPEMGSMGFLHGKLLNLVLNAAPWNKPPLCGAALAGSLLLQTLGEADVSDLARERNDTRTKKIPREMRSLRGSAVGRFIKVHPQ